MTSSADGTTDYATLTDAELASARARVDVSLNPLDHAHLRAELRRRVLDRRRRSLPLLLGVIGVFFTLGGLFALGTLIAAAVQFPFKWQFVAVFSVLLAIGALVLLAGALLLLRRRLGVPIGIAAAIAQMPAFVIGGFGFNFAPLLAIPIAWHRGVVNVSGHFGPELGLHIGSDRPEFVAIDLVSACILILLLRAHRSAVVPANPSLERP